MLNQINLVGHLVADPGSEYTPNGIAVTKFRVACNRDRKTDEGQYETDFFNIVAWRKTAEFVRDYISKGRLVAIAGRLVSRSYVANDGQKRYVTEITAERVYPLEKKDADTSTGADPEEDCFADD